MQRKSVPQASPSLPSRPLRFALVLLAAGCCGVVAGVLSRPGRAAPAAAAATAAPDGPAKPDEPAHRDDRAGRAAPEAAASRVASLDLDTSYAGLFTGLAVFMLLGVLVVAMARGGRRFRRNHGALHLVDTLPLSGRRFLHLVRCGDRQYLVGDSERGVSYLASLPDCVEAPEREGEPAFADLLAQSRSRP